MILLEKFALLVAALVYDNPASQRPLSPSVGHPTSTSAAPACSTPDVTAVTFNELVVTYYGEEVYLTGGIPDLGDWSPDSALLLNASEYTADNPLWYVTVDLAVDATFEYKYIKKEPDGSIIWESDPNRSYTVEGNCDGNATENDSWR